MYGKTPSFFGVLSVIFAYLLVVVGEAGEFGTGAAAVPDECTLNKWELNNGANFILPDGTPRLVIQNAGGSYSSAIRCYFEDGRWKLCSVLCSSSEYQDEVSCKGFYCPVYNDCHKVPQAQGFAKLCAGAFPGEFNYIKPPPDVLKRPIKDTELKRGVPVVDNAGGDKSNGGMPTLATVGLSVVGAVLVVLGAVGAVVARKRSQANNATPRGNDVELGDGVTDPLRGRRSANTEPEPEPEPEHEPEHAHDDDAGEPFAVSSESDVGMDHSQLMRNPNPSYESGKSMDYPDRPGLDQDNNQASTSRL